MYNRLAIAGVAFVFSLFLVKPAFADTYIVLMNMTDQNLSVNGRFVKKDGGGIWSPLDAQIIVGGKKHYSIKDMHRKCSNGAWLIQGTASRRTNLCLPLGFGEIGCVFATLEKSGAGHKISLIKVSGRVCSDVWFSKHGAAMFERALKEYKEAVKRAQDGAIAAAKLIESVAKLKGK